MNLESEKHRGAHARSMAYVQKERSRVELIMGEKKIACVRITSRTLPITLIVIDRDLIIYF